MSRDEDIYAFDERLVRFAGECIFFIRRLPKDYETEYYRRQLLRSSGSAALNYGEAQGTITTKDFKNKASISLKELKESRNCLKVFKYIATKENEDLSWLINEVQQLIAIISKMILNKD